MVRISQSQLTLLEANLARGGQAADRPGVRFKLTPPKIELSEKDVIRQCTDVLRLRGYWVQRNHVGKFQTIDGRWIKMGPPGIPDYTAIRAEYPAIFIEFKRPGKTLRPTQRQRFGEIQEAYRLHAVMIDSLEGLLEYLARHERRSHVDQS